MFSPRRPFPALPALAAALLAGCGADEPESSAGPAAPDAAAAVAPAPAEPKGDAAAGPDLAALAAIRDALPDGQARGLKRPVDQWDRRAEDPRVALQLTIGLQQAAFTLMDYDDSLVYEAFRLSGEAADALVAAGAADSAPPDLLPNVFYNAAAAHGRAGDAAAALADLDRAAEYGWNDWDQLKRDGDFAAVRETAGFGARLAGWETAAATAAAGALAAEARRELAAGESFPLAFTMTDTAGETHTLADYAGKVVVVDIWGTWCPPCRAEVPSFVTLQEKYGDDLQILGLNYDDEPEEIAAFVEEYNMNYPTGPGSEEARAMVPDFEGYPTTVFVGRDGAVRMHAVGLRPEAFLEAVIQELIAEPAPGG